MDSRRPVAILGDLTVWIAVAGVLAGLFLGWLAVSEEGYLDHDLTLLFLERMRDNLFGALLGAACVIYAAAAILAVGRYISAGPKRWLLLALYALALLGIYVFIDRVMDVGVRRYWTRLGTPGRLLILTGIGLAVERVLIPGRIGFLPRRFPRWLAAVFLLVPIGFGLAVPPVRSERVEKVKGKPNFLYLIVDALRADHTGAHGYHRDTTPNLDRLASEGYRFENTVSNSVATRYTVASIFSMVFPGVHKIRKDGQTLSRHFVTVAEHLREAGYETAAWAPNPSIKSAFGFAQGFGTYDDQILSKDESIPIWERFETSRRINTRALDWIRDRGDRPWFIYIHYREPHFPYAPPPLYDGMYYEARADGKPHRPLTPEEIQLQPEPGGMVDGKIRFIRLRYGGGDWDQDMGRGADYNLLLRFHEITRFKIADNTEFIDIHRLRRFPTDRAPPLVFMTGKGRISASSDEVKTLRWYCLEEGGCLFIDNGGGVFHSAVVGLLKRVFPGKSLSDVANDDPIFQQPFRFPNGAPPFWHHAGNRASGIRHNGRWVVFYHPGDVNDAWKTGHADAPPAVAEQDDVESCGLSQQVAGTEGRKYAESCDECAG